jgi:glycosyltransferase involved in cell wall biosynthesis
MGNGLTIGIPVYNEENRIERAIRSAARQCEKLIVADNASTDATGEICQKLLSEYPNMEYFCHTENTGALNNWFFILGKTDTPYIMYLGSHDYIDKGYTGKLLEIMESDSSVEITIGRLCHEVNSGSKDAAQFNQWAGGMSHDAVDRIWAFLFDRSDIAWAMYGIFRTDSYKECFSGELPSYGVDIIFLARILSIGRLIVAGDTGYHAWLRENREDKSDYLERVAAKKYNRKQRIRMRNEFRVAQYRTITHLFPSIGIVKKTILRFQAMARFGTFRTPGSDPLYYLLYIPVKIARKFARVFRWIQREG